MSGFACPSHATDTIESFGDLPPPPKSVPVAPEQHLLLEIVVNERRSGVVAPVFLAGNRIRVGLADLRRSGLQLGAQTAHVYIDELPGMAATYDAPSQQLRLTAAPDFFPAQRFGESRRKFVPASYDMGALLNYDVYVSGGGDRKPEASVWHEARVFGGAGVISTTGVFRSGATKSYVRYDTSWHRSDEATAVTLEAGDLITRTLPWASAVRLGGIQVSRDFAVRPDIITYPLPAFAGRAALPSSVDLIVGGQRVGGGTVDPGPFAIENLPLITGAGEANLAVTDLHGRTISTSMPFYVSSALLRPGLTDFAVALGAFRKRYGVRNFDYGGVAGSASLRHGVSDAITLEVRAEVANDMQLAGGGAVVRLGAGGVVSGSYSRSFRGDGAGGGGSQWTLGYEYQARSFSVALRHSRESAGYADLGFVGAIRAHRARDISSATVSLSFGPGGTVGLGYFAIREDGGSVTSLANASLSLPIWRGSRINASASHELENGSWSGALTLSVPLGRNRGNVAAGIADLPGGGYGWRADYSRAIPSEGGWGWSASAAGQAGDLALRGDVAWRTDPILLRGGAYGGGDATWWAGASGSLVFMDDSVFAANRVSDAFVVVSTDGEAGIPVRYENQLIGRTNADGKLLIPWGTAYYAGQYEIDPLDLDADVAAPVVSQRVAVARGSGHVVRFPVTRTRSARLVIRDEHGGFLPAGTAVRIGESSATIGWDGLLFIENLDKGAAAEIEIAGRLCRLDLVVTASSQTEAGSIADLGEQICAPR
jgi:outer membrane usher protein